MSERSRTTLQFCKSMIRRPYRIPFTTCSHARNEAVTFHYYGPSEEVPTLKTLGDYGNPDEMVSHICSQLSEEFTGTFGSETIQRFVSESFQTLTSARVQAFVPLLIHRFARERLRAAGQAEGVIVKEVPEVLFVCVHNAGRSQMAAALLDRAAEGRVHVRSAGSTPAREIHGGVREAMAEVGIDMAEQFPKPLTDEVVRAADVVITMGCGDACPVYPGKKYVDWELEDPAGRSTEDVRQIRDEIDARVRALLEDLLDKESVTAMPRSRSGDHSSS